MLAQAALQQAEQHLADLNRDYHAARAQRTTLMDSDPAASDAVNAEAGALNSQIRFAMSGVQVAKERVQVAQDELTKTRNAVAELRSEIARREKVRAETQERADSEALLINAAQEQLHDAETHLVDIQPLEQPAAPTAAPEPRPTPVEPLYPPPVRTLYSQPPRCFAIDDCEVNEDGSPLAL